MAATDDNVVPLRAYVDQELGRLDRRIMSVEVVPMQLATVQVEISGMKDDLAELKNDFKARGAERKREADERVAQQVIARRWLVGIVFSAAMLIVGALALLLPLLIAQ